VELVQVRQRAARTEDVKEVIKVMQNSPTAAYLRECSFHEKMMLAALVKCIKREGVEEIKWGDVRSFTPLFPCYWCASSNLSVWCAAGPAPTPDLHERPLLPFGFCPQAYCDGVGPCP
jgi:hypothetical protein